MSVKASKLKNNESQKSAINKEANDILGHIDDALKIAHEQGKHKISIPIPIQFSIPYMSNADSQRSIYYKVITSLISRDFNTQIELLDNASILHIKWLSEDEETEIEEQNNLIAKCSIKN